MSVEDQYKAWIESLTLLDRQLLKDHAFDATPPTKIVDLLKFGPVSAPPASGTEPPKYYYPEPLIRALGLDAPEPPSD
ncbi:MAG: hypothetical protein ACJ73L_11150 [Actinomycetes bacterium]|jgi:hypothetical protein